MFDDLSWHWVASFATKLTMTKLNILSKCISLICFLFKILSRLTKNLNLKNTIMMADRGSALFLIYFLGFIKNIFSDRYSTGKF